MADETIKKLKNYMKLKRRLENHEERLARMKSYEQFPGMRPSDGSKRNPGAADRMGGAVVRRMEYEERVAESLKKAHEEMATIENAIFSLSDPLESEVLQLRYIDGDGAGRHMRWRDVALNIYGDDDERDLSAVYRLHGRALQSLRKVGFE